MSNNQLPPLREMPSNIELDPVLEFEQFEQSCKRLAAEQETAVDSINLWHRLNLLRVDESDPATNIALQTNERVRGIAAREQLRGSKIDALGLLAITGRLHKSVQELKESIDSPKDSPAWKNGDVGLCLPKNMPYQSDLPRQFGSRGLIAATYAVNDHIVRAEVKTAE